MRTIGLKTGGNETAVQLLVSSAAFKYLRPEGAAEPLIRPGSVPYWASPFVKRFTIYIIYADVHMQEVETRIFCQSLSKRRGLLLTLGNWLVAGHGLSLAPT